MKPINVGLIGFGTVGTGVVRILQKNAALLRRRLGAPLRLCRIADRDITTDRGVAVAPDLLTTNAAQVVEDPQIDIVVELIGGIGPARQFIERALAAGKHVVTANKALLSACGPDLFATAAHHQADIAFEASVGGGIPIVRALQEGLCSDRVQSFFGVLNGTANYILSRMTDEGGDFQSILADAQREGYAEADPAFDVEGIDTLHKLCVLIGLAFGRRVESREIYTEGISRITPLDIEFARELGYRIKLLAICRSTGRGVDARVHPTLVPDRHLLARVNGTLNALFIQSEDLGPTMFYGHGAGMLPTASAVVADIMSLGRNIMKGISGRVSLLPGSGATANPIRVMPVQDIRSRYYLRFSAVDKPGVLSKISGVLGRNRISINSVVQRGRRARGGAVPIFMLVHEAREADIRTALTQIERLDILRQKTMLIRIEEEILSPA